MFGLPRISFQTLFIFLIVAALCAPSFGFQKKAMRNSLVRFGKRAPAEEQAAFAAEPEYAAYNSYGNAYAPFNQDPVLSQYRRFYNNYGF